MGLNYFWLTFYGQLDHMAGFSLVGAIPEIVHNTPTSPLFNSDQSVFSVIYKEIFSSGQNFTFEAMTDIEYFCFLNNLKLIGKILRLEGSLGRRVTSSVIPTIY